MLSACVSLSASADWSLKNESELTDLMYLPPVHTLAGLTSLQFETNKAELRTAQDRFASLENRSTSIHQEVTYAIQENRALTLTVEQLLSDKVKTTYGPGSTSPNSVKTSKSEGVKDPALSLRERLRNQSDSTPAIDIIVSASPSLGNNKNATTTTKGNAYRGGTLITMKVEAGKKYTDQSWKLFAGFERFGKTKSIDSSTLPNETTETDSHLDLNFGISWQWVLNPIFSVNLNTGLGLTSEEKSNNTIGNSRVEIDSTNVALVGTDLIFNASKKMAMIIGINGKSYAETDIKYTTISSGASTTLTAKSYTEGIFSAGVKYEF